MIICWYIYFLIKLFEIILKTEYFLSLDWNIIQNSKFNEHQRLIIQSNDFL